MTSSNQAEPVSFCRCVSVCVSLIQVFISFFFFFWFDGFYGVAIKVAALTVRLMPSYKSL